MFVRTFCMLSFVLHSRSDTTYAACLKENVIVSELVLRRNTPKF
jgi:hypothetical protein